MITKKQLKIITIASKDSTRPVINALHVKRISDNEYTIAATDGYRLTEMTITGAIPFEERIIALSTIKQAYQAMGTKELLEFTENGYSIVNPTNDYRLNVTTPPDVEGTYPAYKSLIPDGGQIIKLDPKLLSELLSLHHQSVDLVVQVEDGKVKSLSAIKLVNDGITSVLMPLKG